jgi:hypothetical protein
MGLLNSLMLLFCSAQPHRPSSAVILPSAIVLQVADRL